MKFRVLPLLVLLVVPAEGAAQRQLNCEVSLPSVSQECRAVDYFSEYLATNAPQEASRGTKRSQAMRGVRLWIEELRRHSPQWYEYLPDCPVCAERAEQSPDWSRDAGTLITDLHPDADVCYRSVAGYPSSRSGPFQSLRHRQQCCYDNDGELLRTGGSRGTPDLHNSIGALDPGHVTVDVFPFYLLLPNEYFRFWKPNAGEDAVRNSLTHDISYWGRVPRDPLGGGMAVRRGETLHVSAWGSRSLRLGASRGWRDVTATPVGATNVLGAQPKLSCPWLSVVGVVFAQAYPHAVLESHCIGTDGEVTIGQDGQFGALLNSATHTQDGRRIHQDYSVRSQSDIWVSIRRVFR